MSAPDGPSPRCRAADPGCWGIAIDSGYSSAESFPELVIRGNTVVNVGNVGIGVSACPDCIIENNIVLQERPIGSTLIATPDRTRGGDDAMTTA